MACLPRSLPLAKASRSWHCLIMRLTFTVLFLGLLPLSSALAGRFHLYLSNVRVSSSAHPRDIYVYLPTDYRKNAEALYPVLYMHDGQNLFDPSRAYMGQTWQVEESLNRLIAEGTLPPIIVVAIDNTPDRISEYTHDEDPNYPGGGWARSYLRFLARDLKPKIDRDFRTRDEREQTGIMGSSLGGLVSLYAGATHSQTFGLIGAMSPSVWWNSRSILETLGRSPLPLRLYVDSGTKDGERPADAKALVEAMWSLGMNEQDLFLEVQEGAGHSEKWWAQRFPLAVVFLFQRR